MQKKNREFRNEGLKNQESLGEVEGSEKWKRRIALPTLPLLCNSTFGRMLGAFRGFTGRSFSSCLQPKPIDKPHRSVGATQAAPLGEEQRLLMGSRHDGDGSC